MIVPGSEQRRMLRALMDGEAKSSVRLARELDWGIVKLTRTAHQLVAREQIVRTEDGAYAITRDGIETIVCESDLSCTPIAPALNYPTARAPKTGTLSQRTWTAMRHLKRYTGDDLVEMAAREENTGAAQSVRRYNRGLLRAGYVAQLPRRVRRPGEGSPGLIQYSLVRDTGEIAPSIKSDGSVVDHNGPKPEQVYSPARKEVA